MKNFLVISYDIDAQIWHRDIVQARDRWGATSIICDRRPEVVDAHAWPLHAFMNWCDSAVLPVSL